MTPEHPNKKRIRRRNKWHVGVAIYHLRQISPDHLEKNQLAIFQRLMVEAERLHMNINE